MYCSKSEIYHDGWLILHDADEVGKNEKWYESGIDDKNPREAFVPGYSHQFYPFEYGVFWYQKRFKTNLKAGKNEFYSLRVGPADFYTEVYLNGKLVGTHQGHEDAFEFDVTDFLDLKGENLLLIRTSKPYTKDVDGYNFWQLPHRNETPGVITPGSNQNTCGILGKVELVLLPKCRITDMYITADTKTSFVNILYTVHSDLDKELKAELYTDVGNKRTGEHLTDDTTKFALLPGDNVFKVSIKVDNYTLWDVTNPFLYYVNAVLTVDGGKIRHSLNRHTGFRDFVVKDDGFFYLNGRRIFLRCSHTGNCFPYSTHAIPTGFPEFPYRDLYMAKAMGLNMVRFISGAGLPDQLDYADELGLMIYEEPMSSWLQGNGPRAKEFYQHDLLTMVKRDRSHPSLCILGTLNETLPSDTAYIARESLNDLRDLDETRLVLYSSGRFDGDAFVGSVANPYEREWQCLWNREGKNNHAHSSWQPYSPGGFFENVGDVHAYPRYPTSKYDIKLIREIGNDVKRPVFLSEYGCGSLFDVISLTNKFDSLGVNKDLPDVRQIRTMKEWFLADLKRYGFEDEFAFPQALMTKSALYHSRQRSFSFDLARSNPYMNGISITGLLDHSICGEGLMTYMREWKAGVADALQGGLAPLKWCIFPSDTNVYSGKTFGINAVLANEDVLKEQDYTVTMKIFGENGTVWSKTKTLHPTKEQLSLFSVPVFDEAVNLDVPEGQYEIHCDIEGAAATDGVLKFYITRDDITTAVKGIRVAYFGLEDNAVLYLRRKGVRADYFPEVDEKEKCLIVIGRPSDKEKADFYDKVYRMIENGCRAVVVSRHGVAGPEGWNQYIRLDEKPESWPNYDGRTDWLYHKEYLAKRHHPYFKNMPTGMMDWEYWIYLINGTDFRNGRVPDDVASASFGTGCINDHGYEGGFNIGRYDMGKGALVLCCYDILPNIDANPAADRLLINMLNEEQGKL